MSQSKEQEAFKAELKMMLKKPENSRCADCNTQGPTWASTNLGVFICMRCSGIHRSLGTHISKVKSTVLDNWQAHMVARMGAVGNERARLMYESGVPKGYPRNFTDQHQLVSWINNKYNHKKWYNESADPDLAEDGDDEEFEDYQGSGNGTVSSGPTSATHFAPNGFQAASPQAHRSMTGSIPPTGHRIAASAPTTPVSRDLFADLSISASATTPTAPFDAFGSGGAFQFGQQTTMGLAPIGTNQASNGSSLLQPSVSAHPHHASHSQHHPSLTMAPPSFSSPASPTPSEDLFAMAPPGAFSSSHSASASPFTASNPNSNPTTASGTNSNKPGFDKNQLLSLYHTSPSQPAHMQQQAASQQHLFNLQQQAFQQQQLSFQQQNQNFGAQNPGQRHPSAPQQQHLPTPTAFHTGPGSAFSGSAFAPAPASNHFGNLGAPTTPSNPTLNALYGTPAAASTHTTAQFGNMLMPTTHSSQHSNNSGFGQSVSAPASSTASPSTTASPYSNGSGNSYSFSGMTPTTGSTGHVSTASYLSPLTPTLAPQASVSII